MANQTMTMETVEVQIHTYGKVARFGPDVYKVAHGAEQLAAAGWVPVHRGNSYVYMRAPAGQGARSPRVELRVPTAETCAALAARLHAAGVLWRGDACGWQASYTPHREGTRVNTVFATVLDKTTGQVTMEERREPRAFRDPAQFVIGESLVWQCRATWDDGPGAPPRWSRTVGWCLDCGAGGRGDASGASAI
jgi:hypothetical protein